MRRRLRATCEQPAKARSGGVVRIVMQRIGIADHARKSAGIPRIERKERGKPLVRMGRDHFYFPKSGTDLRCAFWYFLRHRLGGGVPVHLLGLVGRWPRGTTHYSRDLRAAKRGSGVKLHSSSPKPPMSALGQKQTSRPICAMSALPPKADIANDGLLRLP